MKNHLINAAWDEWIEDHVSSGRHPYLMTITFNHLSGSQQTVMRKMKDEIERIYKMIVCKTVRSPRAASAFDKLPIFIGAPDLPVYKKSKTNSAQTFVNAGLHWHIIVLLSPKGRNLALDGDFAHRPWCYHGPDRTISQIHICPIDRNPGDVSDYVQKALRNGKLDEDELLILPKARSEL